MVLWNLSGSRATAELGYCVHLGVFVIPFGVLVQHSWPLGTLHECSSRVLVCLLLASGAGTTSVWLSFS